MKRIVSRLASISLFFVLASIVASAQDFKKSYQLAAGGEISISSVSGDVTVTGYDGDVVVVTGIKEGRDRDLVDVDDQSNANRVDVRVRYPRDCNCNASISFQVQVPRSIKYQFEKLSSASGDIRVSDVTGDLNAKSASGDVTVRNATGSINASSASGDVKVRDAVGIVNARSASGDVEVEIVRLEGSGNMEFKSASGDVTVQAPANLDANVDMSTFSGSIRSDFPIQINKREHGTGSTARGQIGGGSRQLRLSSASGNINLLGSSLR
jgi:hypothetical protein